jgi:catalase
VKITKQQLKKIIQEELSKTLKEDDWPPEASGLSVHGKAEKLYSDMDDDEQDELIKTLIEPLIQSIPEKIREHLWEYFDKVEEQHLAIHLALQWLEYSEEDQQSGYALKGLQEYLINVWKEASQWSPADETN